MLQVLARMCMFWMLCGFSVFDENLIYNINKATLDLLGSNAPVDQT